MASFIPRQPTRQGSASLPAARFGFTLVELLVSLTIFGIVAGAVVGVQMRTQRSYTAQRSMLAAQDVLRTAELAIGRVLRSARADPRLNGVAMIHPDPRGTGRFDNIRVTSDLNADGTVTDNGATTQVLEDVQFHVNSDTLFVRWHSGAPVSPLAYPVRSLAFDYYKSDLTPLTTAAAVRSATRVKVTITAPRHPNGTTLIRRETWVFLRNR